jgi:hypothetical protein
MLCECGCGRDAGVYDKTRNGQGMVKGQPKKFILGHSGGPIELARIAPREHKQACKRGHLRTPDNLYGNYGCKACQKDRTKVWRKANPVEHWKRGAIQNRKRQYGMTQEQYEMLLKGQDYKCAICRVDLVYSTADGKLRSQQSACVDHAHNGTKNFRGLLCAMCNRALGLFKEDTVALSNAIQYLNKFKETQCNQNLSSELSQTAQTATA